MRNIDQSLKPRSVIWVLFCSCFTSAGLAGMAYYGRREEFLMVYLSITTITISYMVMSRVLQKEKVLDAAFSNLRSDIRSSTHKIAATGIGFGFIAKGVMAFSAVLVSESLHGAIGAGMFSVSGYMLTHIGLKGEII